MLCKLLTAKTVRQTQLRVSKHKYLNSLSRCSLGLLENSILNMNFWTYNRSDLFRFIVQFMTTLLIIVGPGNCQVNQVESISDASLNNSLQDTQATLISNNVNTNLPVILSISPYKSHFGTIYVPAGEKINATAVIRDLINTNNQFDVSIQWSTREGVIPTDSNLTSIEHVFQNASDDNFIRVDIKHGNDTGSAKIDFYVREPVNVLDPIGNLFLEHGEMLDIKLSFKGTGPFYYCYRFCMSPCSFCPPIYETSKNELLISHYLSSVGNYTLLLDISNVMNRETKQYTIKIYDSIRGQSLPFVPIVCSILAVFILITGVGLHLHFRKTAYTETANFDFIRQTQDDEDWEEELSFIQRVRYLFYGESQDDEYNESRHLLDTTVTDRVNKINGA